MMNRREWLGSAGAFSLAPVMPSLGMASGFALSSPLEATLLLEPAHSGAGNHRWARVREGVVTGATPAVVLSGRLDWHVDPASGAVIAALQCRIRCADGEVRELRERALQAAGLGQGRVRVVASATP